MHAKYEPYLTKHVVTDDNDNDNDDDDNDDDDDDDDRQIRIAIGSVTDILS